jgi:hypothetical protein
LIWLLFEENISSAAATPKNLLPQCGAGGNPQKQHPVEFSIHWNLPIQRIENSSGFFSRNYRPGTKLF